MYMFLRSTCNITCELCQIPCACVECTYMLEKLWVNGFSPQQQPRYQPVKNFPYWTGQGSFKNWNIITLSHKSITSEDFEEMHQVVLGGISNNMALLVQYGKYGAMNTTYTTTIGYYLTKLVLEYYTLQEDTTCDEGNIT